MTPGESARAEAAKQAVILAASLIGMLAMWPVYKRLIREQQAALGHGDPAMAEIDARARALESARRYDRLASYLFWVAPGRAFWWAHDKAEQARKAARAES
jgi:hypothetical protein